MPFAEIKAITPASFKVLDIGVMGNSGSMQSYILDENSNIWGWGQSVCDQYTSTPYVFPKNNVRYTKLSNGCIAFDASSYAWNWGNSTNMVLINGIYGTIFNPIYPGTVVAPIQIPGKQWLDIQGQQTHRIGLDFSSYAWAWGTNNTSGPLGDNTSTARYSPVSVVGGKQFIKIAVGYNVSVALDSNSYAWAWGNNASGQLGINSNVSQSSPVSVIGGKQFRKIITNQSTQTEFTTLALDGSSYCWAWGTNSYGQFGNNTYGGSASTSSPISVNGPWDNIYSLGGNSFVGLKNSNIYVWGQNSVGEFGNNTLIGAITPLATHWPLKAGVLKIVGSSYSTDTPHVLALDNNSTLWAWGYNPSGYALASGDAVSYSVVITPGYRKKVYTEYSPPVVAPNITTNFYAGPNYNYLDSSGFAWVYGSTNNSGQMGTNNTNVASLPTSVVGGIRFLRITQTYNTCTAGIDLSSYAWTWGSSTNSGTLGDGNNVNRSSPVSVIGGKQWRKIVAGTNSFTGIDLLSYVWVWGSNQFGQIGDNTGNNRSSPTSVVGLGQVLDVEAVNGNNNGYANMVLNNTSYIWAWGYNGGGLCGSNNNVNSFSSPVSVVAGKRFIKIGSAGNNFFALDSSSYAWAWGQNSLPGCGDNNTANRSSPVSVVGGKQFVALYSLGSTSGTIGGGYNASSYAWVWGAENNYLLGDNDVSTNSKSSPVSIVGGFQFTNLQCYDTTYTLGISGGSIYVWGNPNAFIFNRGWGGGSNAINGPLYTIQQTLTNFTYITSPVSIIKNIFSS